MTPGEGEVPFGPEEERRKPARLREEWGYEDALPSVVLKTSHNLLKNRRGGKRYREPHSSQWRERALTPKAKLSGKGETKTGRCALNLVAKKST